MSEILKSELAIKFDEWLKTEDGLHASETHDLLITSKYEQLMDKKLQAAFLAGAIANEEVGAEIEDKLLQAIKPCY